ncbi:hypothetical protein [Nocardia fluminea]|uniref:Uncharacterized protein n=1 Tax=Nocardia fluminea TaxID=134984 RepID=A0A2N3VGW7_9NOCA|nr:hypothetical protein [Nocardia fluminea]PKV80856.1 hypothetical protein ATK86_5293 [Nocardia fluminea]
MSTDPRTPAEVADWLTEKATDAKAVAAERYPHDPTARRIDETAQLRLLVEQAAESLREFERHLDEIFRLNAELDLKQARHEYTTARLRRRIRHGRRSRAALRATRLEIAS